MKCFIFVFSIQFKGIICVSALPHIDRLAKADVYEKNITLTELKKYIQATPETSRQIGAEELLLWIKSKLTTHSMQDLLLQKI
ncbi:MAG TPA: hypothetical protein ENJ53_09985 [Phaeodactylibacter sp.]|nr:hypothetical protein [Phaeodactylibacter sp.]